MVTSIYFLFRKYIVKYFEEAEGISRFISAILEREFKICIICICRLHKRLVPP